MSRNEILSKLDEIAWSYRALMCGEEYWAYEDERNELNDRWNELVPEAERNGISHKELVAIWKGEDK